MHHKLKKVIHPNRYFIWALFLILISGSALTAYIIWSSYGFDREFVFNDITARRVFTDRQLGYSARYPGNWVLERDHSGNMIFEDPNNAAESITVYPGDAGLESAIRKTLNIKSERDVAKGNMLIDTIQAAGPKGSGQIFNVAFITSGSKFFYISGYSSLFDQFINNFKVQ